MAFDVGEWVLTAGVLLTVGVTFARAALDSERRAQLRVLARRRARRAERAAFEASLDDPWFSPDAIRTAVDEILAAAQTVWSGGGGGTLRERKDGRLIRSWAAGRQQQIGQGLYVIGRPGIEVLRVVNREREAEDRVILRLQLHIHRDPKASANFQGDQTIFALHSVHIEDRWTLGRSGESWRLVSVSGDPLSERLIEAPLIASPAGDEERLREEGLREVAASETVPRRILLGELVDAGRPAPEQLRELALLDDRFSPALIEATIGHVLEAWEGLTDDAQRPLEQVASGKAIHSLMYPGGPGGRRFIRDASLAGWTASFVDPDGAIPSVEVRVKIKAAIYRSDGRNVTGSDRRRRRHELIWKLRLEDDGRGGTAWRLATSSEG